MKRIPQFNLVREPAEDTASQLPSFKWAADDVGKRNQLGGDPQLLQELTWPSCPDCQEKMTFYGQLDSINDEFIIADCGMVYVFVCLDCNESKSIIQSG